VRAALSRGVVFELNYAPAIREPSCRRQLVANAAALVRATGGAGILLSSGAVLGLELRCPRDVANLAVLFGFTSRDAGRAALGVTGLDVAVRAVNWTLTGVPGAALVFAAESNLLGALYLAANVLCFDEQGWSADNTDGIGLVRDIEQHAGQRLAGRRALLIGAGGAAAGVLGPLIAAGCDSITVANRTLTKALVLVERHQAWACWSNKRLRPLRCGAG
jgi:hypothetical protein